MTALWGRMLGRGRAAAVDEGMLLAEGAVRLGLRNRIQVGTIGRGQDYDPAEFRGDAVAALQQLAAEQDGVAERLENERRLAGSRNGWADSEHDYQRSDRGNLRARARIARLMAERLRGAAEDPARVDELVERARQEAWDDVSNQIERRMRMYASPPEVVDENRSQRLSGLAADLAAEFASRQADDAAGAGEAPG